MLAQIERFVNWVPCRVPVVSLHASGHKSIRLDEVCNCRVVPAGIVVHQPKVGHVAVLTGVGVVRRGRAAGVAHLSLAQHPRSEAKGAGLVAYLGDKAAVSVSRNRAAAQLVGEQVGDRAVALIATRQPPA